MQAVAAIVEAWLTQRRAGVIARIIGAEGRGPRPSNELLLIDANGRTGGSLPAGAVQPEVVTEIIAVRGDRSGGPRSRSTGRITG